jgi:hypothetical protein
LTYVDQIMWFAIGFGTGAVAAVASRWGDTHMVRVPAVRIGKISSSSPGVRVTLGVLIFLAIVTSLLLSYFQRENLASVTTCQAQYNSDIASIITERAKLNDADRTATTNLIVGVFTPAPGLTQKQESVRAEHLFLVWKKAEDQYQARLREDRFPSLQNRCG